MATRLERDTLGPVEVPADAYFGAQTARALALFDRVLAIEPGNALVAARLGRCRAAAGARTRGGDVRDRLRRIPHIFIERRSGLCRRLEAEEDATVKLIDPRAAGWFDVESLPILQAARRERLTTARTGFDMGIPFNDLNRVFDLGFKPLPWGDQGYVPRGLSRVEEQEAPRPKN